MGANIYWQPLKGKHLPVGARSQFVRVMTDAFGSYPWNLSEGDASRLRDLAIGAQDDGIREALGALADAVHAHGQITVWPEY